MPGSSERRPSRSEPTPAERSASPGRTSKVQPDTRPGDSGRGWGQAGGSH